VCSVVGGACLAAYGTWLDSQPYTLERVVVDIAILAAAVAIALVVPLGMTRARDRFRSPS
jgi:hypothetical protein